VLWLLELKIRRDRRVHTQVRTVNSNSRISNSQCSLFKKNRIIWIFCISGWLSFQNKSTSRQKEKPGKHSCKGLFSTTHKLFNSSYVHRSLRHWHMFTDALLKKVSNGLERQASRPLACCGILMVAGGVIVSSFSHGSHLQFLSSGVLGGKCIIFRQ